MKNPLKRPFYSPPRVAAREGLGNGGAPCARYAFLLPQEAALVEAIVSRLIPDDVLGAGALEADVPAFIDRQLAGAWGARLRLYRKPGCSDLAADREDQIEYSPAELFRRALRGLQARLQRDGLDLEQMTGRQLDDWLATLQEEECDLDGAPAIAFFESVWSLTLEGYFTDLDAAGDLDVVSWKLLNFLDDGQASAQSDDSCNRGSSPGSRSVFIQTGPPRSPAQKR